MAFVQFNQVCKQYQDQKVLSNIDFSVEPGEFVVLVGPSGCGKSTLLRMLAGLEAIDDGEILLQGRCINQLKPSERDMAMVFQNYALYPHMTVYDNMAYSLKIKKLNKREIDLKVKQAAEMLKIDAYLNRKPSELSGGQRQRVAMGRAMVRHPSVFLFDEPLSNLDSNLRMEMRYEIKKLHEKLNATSIYVTHDQTEAMTMADRMIVLNQGTIEQIGAPEIIYESPKTPFVAQFTGHYPINELQVTFLENGRYLKLTDELVIPVPDSINFSRVKEGEMINLFIRPEDLMMVDNGQLKGQLLFIENMGADSLLRVKIAGLKQPLIIRVAASPSLRHNDISLALDWRRIHFFDPKSGQRL